MSIVTGLDRIVDRHLQVETTGSSSPHHAHRTAAIRLSSGRPAGFDARQLLQDLYLQLVTNLAKSPRFPRQGPSRENWRLEKRVGQSRNNTSPETQLERAIANATGNEWNNQVPVAAGLWSSSAHKRAAIDLVYCRSTGCFELIELKVASDTPLRAAVEIIEYGLLWALARERYPESLKREKKLLQANEIHLRVLAPENFYQGYQLGWLEREVNSALSAFSTQQFGGQLLASFRFDAFPSGFTLEARGVDLLNALRERASVWDTINQTLSTGSGFQHTLKQHLSTWAKHSGLAQFVESDRNRPWVLAEEHRELNLFRPEWWRYIEGREHRWVRALNSSQCFAVNLFAPLADDSAAARRFVRRMLDRKTPGLDTVRVCFEHTPDKVAFRLGERGQPTQFDVFFELVRKEVVFGTVGVEVKLSETEFGRCRGWDGRRSDARPLNPDPQRCLDGPRLFEAPNKQCYLAEREDRKYWELMKKPGSSFLWERVTVELQCPLRHGLYQLMRNRVALDECRENTGTEWSEFAICVHPANSDVFHLPAPVAGTTDAREAFRALVRPSALLEWNTESVLDAVIESGSGSEAWTDWMRAKYMLDGPVLNPLKNQGR